MAFNKASSRQIQPGAITNEHISVGTLIDESKLNINWATRGQEVLASRLLVDFVQVAGKSVTATTNSVTVTDVITSPVANTDTIKGAVVQTGKNRVIVRNSTTGEPIKSVDLTEVYGRLTHNGTDYVVSFFYRNASAVETAYTFDATTLIDFQYPQRFDLASVSETFAANEKFVDGAADVSTRLDLEQLVLDAFGNGYALTHNGTAARAKSIVAELSDVTHGTVNTTVSASATIDEVIAARNGSADLNTRLGTIETNVGTASTGLSSLQSEVTTARGTEASLDARLDAIETVDTAQNGRLTALEAIDHQHYAEDHQVLAADPLINTSRYDLVTGTFVAGNKSLNVYVNGALQMEGVHYAEITNAGSDGIAVSFSPDVILENDVLQFRWTK